MTKQYNSEIEKELHLTRLSIERIEKKTDKIITAFDLLLTEAIKMKEVKRAKKGST